MESTEHKSPKQPQTVSTAVLTPAKRVNIKDEPVLLFDKKSTDSSPAIQLLVIGEVARLLKISISGVRRLQQARHLPFIKVGGSIRFSEHDILAYLKKQRVEAVG